MWKKILDIGNIYEIADLTFLTLAISQKCSEIADFSDFEVPFPPEGRAFLAQCGKFSTYFLYSGRQKKEPKIEIQMKICHVLKILLDRRESRVRGAIRPM